MTGPVLSTPAVTVSVSVKTYPSSPLYLFPRLSVVFHPLFPLRCIVTLGIGGGVSDSNWDQSHWPSAAWSVCYSYCFPTSLDPDSCHQPTPLPWPSSPWLFLCHGYFPGPFCDAPMVLSSLLPVRAPCPASSPRPCRKPQRRLPRALPGPGTRSSRSTRPH